ncbi:hypothetical protein F900_01049 [Acinetobacter modestus]|uniref:Uncharacterized protein n=1 Tax=Acinetobacter modestus TaxID=1776740 RepID=N9M254_9GAMM|nr:hypothetical protein F900_01049 [Acinetobacter modestus]
MMALALQGVLKMAEYCAQCAKEYRIKNGIIGECVSHDCDVGNHAVNW